MMFRLARPGRFLSELSGDFGLKFALAWLTFVALVIPGSILISLGVSEKYVLPSLLAAILPFQYAVYCSWQASKLRRRASGPRHPPITDDDRPDQYSRRTSDIPSSSAKIPAQTELYDNQESARLSTISEPSSKRLSRGRGTLAATR